MKSFKYTTLPLSIEDTPFSYVTNIDDYRTMYHILEVVVNEKATNAIYKGVFQKILKTLSNTINVLSKNLKDSKTIDTGKLERLIKNGDKLLILVNNEDYYSFACYPKGFEENNDKIVYSNPPSVLYNVGQLESSGSISVVPSNSSVFLSSLLYAYGLLNGNNFYRKINIEALSHISIIYYNIMVQSFGRKSGLLTGERIKKEKLFFLCCCFTYSLYVPDNKSLANLKQFLAYCASNTGSAHYTEFLNSLAQVIPENKDIWDTSNYNELQKFSSLARKLDLLEISESEMKIQWFKLLGTYGVMALENYARFAAYIVASLLANSYITSTIKMYNTASYVYLSEYFAKDLYTF